MNIRCVPMATNRPARRAASVAMRILPSVLLFAALYGSLVSLDCVAFRSVHLLVGGTCAALLSSLHGHPRARMLTLLLMIAALAVGFAVAGEVRTGAGMACNALFSASEAVNRYSYVRIALSSEVDLAAGVTAFGHWVALALAVVAGGIAGSQSPAAPLLAAGLLIAAETYFGVVPDAGLQLLLFGCLGGLIVGNMAHGKSWTNIAAGVAAWLIIGLIVGMLLPGVHPVLEDRSEQIRDWLSEQWPGGTAAVSAEDISRNQVRQESLLTQENAAETPKDGEDARSYERQQKFQRDISDPRPVDYWKTILMLLLVVALLVGPFLPFLWLERQKRKAVAMREAFDAPDPAEAIAAMFRHIARCLVACGLQPGSGGFAMLDGPVMPDEYWDAYREGVALWQEAAYSNHPMTEKQRTQIAALLRQTQRLVFDRADRRVRFRMQYIDCLILVEDLE